MGIVVIHAEFGAIRCYVLYLWAGIAYKISVFADSIRIG